MHKALIVIGNSEVGYIDSHIGNSEVGYIDSHRQ